jgi:hypothetical protein
MCFQKLPNWQKITQSGHPGGKQQEKEDKVVITKKFKESPFFSNFHQKGGDALGAVTITIMTLSIMTLDITTLSLLTINIMTLS